MTRSTHTYTAHTQHTLRTHTPYTHTAHTPLTHTGATHTHTYTHIHTAHTGHTHWSYTPPAGESGLGKSTLVNSLFLTDLYNKRANNTAAGRTFFTIYASL